MKKILKTLLIVILILIFIFAGLYIAKFNKIEHQSSIAQSADIKNLDNKVFYTGFLQTDSSKISTDFRFDRRINADTVSFNFTPSLHEQFDSGLNLNFNSGDGYSGLNVDVLKISNRFSTSVNTYTDNIKFFDFLDRDAYSVKKQKLILDKTEYKSGDSIFGKIELEMKSNITDSVYQAGGYFRGKIK